MQQMGFPCGTASKIEDMEAEVRKHAARQYAATRVRLSGLRGAAHLNGHEGDVRGRALQLCTFPAQREQIGYPTKQNTQR
jgi:hypothetical protein